MKKKTVKRILIIFGSILFITFTFICIHVARLYAFSKNAIIELKEDEYISELKGIITNEEDYKRIFKDTEINANIDFKYFNYIYITDNSFKYYETLSINNTKLENDNMTINLDIDNEYNKNYQKYYHTYLFLIPIKKDITKIKNIKIIKNYR